MRINRDSHPKIAVTYHHIGMALDKQDGDADEALTCMLKSVEIEDQCPSIAEEVTHYISRTARATTNELSSFSSRRWTVFTKKSKQVKVILSCMFSVCINIRPSH